MKGQVVTIPSAKEFILDKDKGREKFIWEPQTEKG
jgi:hypothetical protein